MTSQLMLQALCDLCERLHKDLVPPQACLHNCHTSPILGSLKSPFTDMLLAMQYISNRIPLAGSEGGLLTHRLKTCTQMSLEPLKKVYENATDFLNHLGCRQSDRLKSSYISLGGDIMNTDIFSWSLLCHHLWLLNKNEATSGYNRLSLRMDREGTAWKYSLEDTTFSILALRESKAAPKGSALNGQGSDLCCQTWLCSLLYWLPTSGQRFAHSHEEKHIHKGKQTLTTSSDAPTTSTWHGRCSSVSCCFNYASPTWLLRSKQCWAICHCWKVEASSLPSNTAEKE